MCAEGCGMVQNSYWIGINYIENDPTPEDISNYESFVDVHFCFKVRAALRCDSSHVVSQGMYSIMSLFSTQNATNIMR